MLLPLLYLLGLAGRSAASRPALALAAPAPRRGRPAKVGRGLTPRAALAQPAPSARMVRQALARGDVPLAVALSACASVCDGKRALALLRGADTSASPAAAGLAAAAVGRGGDWAAVAELWASRAVPDDALLAAWAAVSACRLGDAALYGAARSALRGDCALGLPATLPATAEAASPPQSRRRQRTVRARAEDGFQSALAALAAVEAMPRRLGALDLHGLRVQDAELALAFCLERGDAHASEAPLRVIAGRGLHSAGGRPAIKQRLLTWCSARDGVAVEVDAGNPGQLLVVRDPPPC